MLVSSVMGKNQGKECGELDCHDKFRASGSFTDISVKILKGGDTEKKGKEQMKQ